MRILLVHNNHRLGGGSDVVAQDTARLLAKAGHEVTIFSRDSKELEKTKWKGPVTAFFSGIYNPSSLRAFKQTLRQFRPDVVHAHTLFPLITPWIFPLCKRMGIPSVMTCHDYGLTCPIYTHLRQKQVCTLCPERNEMQCIRHNCAGALTVSMAYALRNGVARKFKLYNTVSLFLTPSAFTKEWLVRYAQIPKDRIHVVGNIVRPPVSIKPYRPEDRAFIGYAGRFSVEKGIDVLLDAAARVDIPIKLAGDARELGGQFLGRNIEATGLLNTRELSTFYNGARFIVVPSIWFETFNLVTAEAMAHGLPILCSRIGALPELVEDNANGFLTEPGSFTDLADHMQRLWTDLDLCRKMSESSLNKAHHFISERYLERIEAAYKAAIRMNRASP